MNKVKEIWLCYPHEKNNDSFTFSSKFYKMRHDRLVYGNHFHRARCAQTAGTPADWTDFTVDVSHLRLRGIFSAGVFAAAPLSSPCARHSLCALNLWRRVHKRTLSEKA